MLQRVAVCSSILQCRLGVRIVAVCCSLLQSVAECCSTLQRVAVRRSILQCRLGIGIVVGLSLVWWGGLKCSIGIHRIERDGEWEEETPRRHCNILLHTATHCNTLPHTATHCNTLSFSLSPLLDFTCVEIADLGRRFGQRLLRTKRDYKEGKEMRMKEREKVREMEREMGGGREGETEKIFVENYTFQNKPAWRLQMWGGSFARCPRSSNCVAVCYNVLQCVAVCCSVLQMWGGSFARWPRLSDCVAICCSVCCSALDCVAVCCSVLQCVAHVRRKLCETPTLIWVCHSALYFVAVLCSVLQCVPDVKRNLHTILTLNYRVMSHIQFIHVTHMNET